MVGSTRHSKEEVGLFRFIKGLVPELRHFPGPVAEEKIVLEVVRRFGPPANGDTDMIRTMICKAQGRAHYAWKHPWKNTSSSRRTTVTSANSPTVDQK